MLPDMVEFRPHAVAGLYRLETQRRSGHDNVARHQRVEGRSVGDQLGDAVLHVVRVGALSLFAVHEKSIGDVVRIRDFISGDQPGAQNRIGVDGLARARRLRAAQRHVEAYAVSHHMAERLRQRNVAAAATADDRRELGLRVGAPIGKTDRDALRRADKRAVGLEKQTRRVGFLAGIVELAAAEVELVGVAVLAVAGSADDLVGIGHRAEKLHARQWMPLAFGGGGLDRRTQRGETGNHLVMHRKRPAAHRQRVESARHVDDFVLLNQSKAAVVKATHPHKPTPIVQCFLDSFGNDVVLATV